MQIAYTTTFDAQDAGAFGGRGYYMARALEQIGALTYLGPLAAPLERLYTLPFRLTGKVTRRRYFPERDAALLRSYGRQLRRRIATLACDVVFSPMSPGSQPVAYLRCRQPIVIWTDTTLVGALPLYPELQAGAMSRRSLRDGLRNEQAAMERAQLLIYSSTWAADAAIAAYGLPPERVAVVPFGANLAVEPEDDPVAAAIAGRAGRRVELLFIGRSWYRKGGDIAVGVVEALRQGGLDASLTIVGCMPPWPGPYPAHLNVVGFLNTAVPAGRRRYAELLSRSHLLLLPTRADCTPFVINEALAHGLPCVAARIGGIESLIREGITGHTVAPSSVEAAAATVADLLADPARYLAAAQAARLDYVQRLNWRVAAEKVGRLLATL